MEASNSFKQKKVCCFFFAQCIVRLQNLLPEVAMQGQTGDHFQKTAHTRWIYVGPLIAKVKTQALAQKALDLQTAGGACNRVVLMLFP